MGPTASFEDGLPETFQSHSQPEGDADRVVDHVSAIGHGWKPFGRLQCRYTIDKPTEHSFQPGQSVRPSESPVVLQ